ncbi:MAG: hypothetical protein Q6351_006930 [Candidatus Njordarchaeum guaymaensis]
MIVVNLSRIKEFAKLVKNLRIKIDPFNNPNFFPPEEDSNENVSRFFIFMVAIDHRTSHKGMRFEGFIDGKFYHGSDLLYRLGMIKYLEDPEFFSPSRMAKINESDIKNWLSLGKNSNIKIWDPKIRTYLLQDVGEKILKLYNGKVMNVISSSRGHLRNLGYGFIEHLKVFSAFQDPVEKKPFLLAKFLSRRGILNIKDPENIHVPVDNHLIRIAIRFGLIDPIASTEKLFTSWGNKEISWTDDIIIRLQIRRAYRMVADYSRVNPFILDDLLWSLGRDICIWSNPLCDKGRTKILEGQGCPFRHACLGYSEGRRKYWNEPYYYNTWYY